MMDKYLYTEEVQAKPAILNMWQGDKLITTKGWHVRDENGLFRWVTNEEFKEKYKRIMED